MAEFIPDPAMMQRALELADEAAALEEVPVGAVIVHKPTGRIVGEGYNRRETDRSPLAHAEIMAIDQASRTLGGWRLLDSVLYVTLVQFCMRVWIRLCSAHGIPRAARCVLWKKCSRCPIIGSRRFMRDCSRQNAPES